MFGKKQEQVVNFNELLEQMRAGEQAKVRLDRIILFLVEQFERGHSKFVEKKETLKETEELYTWYYPFKMFESDDMEKIGELLCFQLSPENKAKMEEDLKFAVEHNNRAKEIKKQMEEENNEG